MRSDARFHPDGGDVEEISGNIDRDVVVEVPTLLTALVSGDVLVAGSGDLVLRGLILGNLTIDCGASATVYGTVAGGVVNNGGSCVVHGLVVGRVTTNGGTTTLLADGSEAGHSTG